MSLIENYNYVKKQIKNTVAKSKFNQQVNLIVVSKKADCDLIQKLYDHGQRDFAENYAQKLYIKAKELDNLNINWHFIGKIQSNKIGYIAEKATWVHSLESTKHAILLNKKRQNLSRLNVLIEVNISDDKNKHGIDQEEEKIIDLAQVINCQENLVLRGLMGIASHTNDMQIVAGQFQKLKNIYDNLNLKGFSLDTLSMGMSNDFETAILCGSNTIRIGSLIFET